MKVLPWIVLSFVLGLATPLVAAAVQPQTLIENTSTEVIEVLRANRDTLQQDPAALYSLVNTRILPHFDFEKVSRLVLGKHWRKASDEQKAGFMREFQTLLVRTYATALFDFIDEEIVYLPTNASDSARDVVVRTEVRRRGGLPVPVIYRLSRVGEDWKVFDVTIEGISLVTNYRSGFSREVLREGLDSLIAKLAARNAEVASLE